MPKLIGLNSMRGKSGKDTLCDMLGSKAVRFAFGDALKDECAKVISKTPLERSEFRIYMDDQDQKDTPMNVLAIKNLPSSDYKMWLSLRYDTHQPRTPRFHLQQAGNGYHRDHLDNPNVWLNVVKAKVDTLLRSQPQCEFIVITDVRQLNEFAWIAAYGGKTLEIMRDWYIEGVDDTELHITDRLSTYVHMHTIHNRYGNKNIMLDQFKDIVKTIGDANEVQIYP